MFIFNSRGPVVCKSNSDPTGSAKVIIKDKISFIVQFITQVVVFVCKVGKKLNTDFLGDIKVDSEYIIV